MTVADTGFLVSLYLPESTTARARALVRRGIAPILLTQHTLTELRNALNLGIFWKRISVGERDAYWREIEEHIVGGFYEVRAVSFTELHALARELSDRYTPQTGTRSLDLLHVAAALLLRANLFLSFDERQRTAAKGEGLKVKP